MSLTELVHDFKQVSGFRLKQLTRSPVWQVSYFDRILRKEESILDVASYIWENPIKAGLAANAIDYAFSGPRELLAAWVDQSRRQV